MNEDELKLVLSEVAPDTIEASIGYSTREAPRIVYLYVGNRLIGYLHHIGGVLPTPEQIAEYSETLISLAIARYGGHERQK